MSTSSSVPGSPATGSNITYNLKLENHPEIHNTDATNSNIMQDLRRQVFQGQLYKFTNVVKGWQYRWFELHPETGHLEYYYYEDHGLHDLVSGKDKSRKVGNKGKKEHIAGAVVVPSEEDSQTFNVNFASGESYKLRAPNVKERQIWVDRIRAVSQLHDRAIAHSNPPVGKNVLLNHHEAFHEPPPGSKTHLNKHGEPSDALQNLSLSVLDAFGSVHDILYQSNNKHQKLSDAINTLPMKAPDQKTSNMEKEHIGPFCHDNDLLLLKATSQSALACMENALAILQDIREAQRGSQIQNKNQEYHQKSASHTGSTSLKGHRISGLLSPMAMSPSRKISSSSNNSNFYTNDPADNMVSTSSLNQADENVATIQHLDAKRENRPQLDTLSVKSAIIAPLEQEMKSTGNANEHGLNSNFSRSTPSVSAEQNMENRPQAQSDCKLNMPKDETHGQSS